MRVKSEEPAWLFQSGGGYQPRFSGGI